jgi:hypothetical protein
VLVRLGSYVKRHHVALLALFVALGGTSYAAMKLPKNSVGSRQLKKNAVTASKVKNGSLKSSDFAPSALAAAKGDKGDKGDPGPAPAGWTLIPSKNVVAHEAYTVDDARPDAPAVPIYTRGPITLYAKCLWGSSTDFTLAEIYASISGGSALFDSQEKDGPLTVSTNESDRLVAAYDDPGNGGQTIGSPEPVRFVVDNGAKFAVYFQLASTTAIKTGFTSQHSCLYFGHVVG